MTDLLIFVTLNLAYGEVSAPSSPTAADLALWRIRSPSPSRDSRALSSHSKCWARSDRSNGRRLRFSASRSRQAASGDIVLRPACRLTPAVIECPAPFRSHGRRHSRAWSSVSRSGHRWPTCWPDSCFRSNPSVMRRSTTCRSRGSGGGPAGCCSFPRRSAKKRRPIFPPTAICGSRGCWPPAAARS